MAGSVAGRQPFLSLRDISPIRGITRTRFVMLRARRSATEGWGNGNEVYLSVIPFCDEL